MFHNNFATRIARVLVTSISFSQRARRYRKLRVSNKKFYERVGRFPHALEFLEALGFERVRWQTGLEESAPPGHRRKLPGILDPVQSICKRNFETSRSF